MVINDLSYEQSDLFPTLLLQLQNALDSVLLDSAFDVYVAPYLCFRVPVCLLIYLHGIIVFV